MGCSPGEASSLEGGNLVDDTWRQWIGAGDENPGPVVIGRGADLHPAFGVGRAHDRSDRPVDRQQEDKGVAHQRHRRFRPVNRELDPRQAGGAGGQRRNQLQRVTEVERDVGVIDAVREAVEELVKGLPTLHLGLDPPGELGETIRCVFRFWLSPTNDILLQTGYFIMGRPPHRDIETSLMGKFGAAGQDLWHNFGALFGPDRADWRGLALFYDDVFLPYLVGGILPGLISAFACYWLFVPVISAYQNRRRRKLRAKLQALGKNPAAPADGAAGPD